MSTQPPPPIEVEKTTITQTGPAQPEAKFILAQKRFWLALLTLGAWLIVLRYVFGLSWQEAFGDERTIAGIAAIIGMVGLGGVYASVFKGAKRTVFSRVAEELSKQTPEPQITDVQRIKVGGGGFGPLELPGKAPKQGRGGAELGFARVGVLWWVCVAVVALWGAGMAAGCGTLGERFKAREVEGDVVDVDIDPGPPCVVKTSSDGQTVSTVIGRKRRCNIVVDAPAPEGSP